MLYGLASDLDFERHLFRGLRHEKETDGLARGFDPGGTVFDVQMNVLKLQCAGECIEITGDAFDVGNGMR